MDFTQFAIAGFVLVGLVNGVQFLTTKQWDRFLFFLIAVVAGAVFGYLKWFELPSVEIGIAVGLGSSGVYKVAQKLGDSA